MKTHHTITITIPTAKIAAAGAGVLVGLVVGTAIACAVVAGIDIPSPFIALPLLRLPRASGAVVARDTVDTVPAEIPAHVWRALDAMVGRVLTEKATMIPTEGHPAVVAFDRIPAHVQRALDAMVDRVLTEKVAA